MTERRIRTRLSKLKEIHGCVNSQSKFQSEGAVEITIRKGRKLDWETCNIVIQAGKMSVGERK